MSSREQDCFDWMVDTMGPGLSYIFITKFFPHDRKDKVIHLNLSSLSLSPLSPLSLSLFQER